MKKHSELRGICLLIFGLAMLQLSFGIPLSYAEITCHNFINDQLGAICVNGVNIRPPYASLRNPLAEVFGHSGLTIKPHILKICCYKKCSYSIFKQYCAPFPTTPSVNINNNNSSSNNNNNNNDNN